MSLVSTPAAARHLGVSRRMFERRRIAGCVMYQPDHTDPDSGIRSYDLMRIDAYRRRSGELEAERCTP